jgi:hypothetical protein
MALTQPLAVEPLRRGLRGVTAQCFVVNRIFRILLPPELKTDSQRFCTRSISNPCKSMI